MRRASDGALAYYLAWHATPASLAALVAVAGRRWAIEESFQVSKDQFGLDQYQTRSWTGWHRHTTLTMVSFGLTVLATRDDQPQPATTAHELAHHEGPIAVTINEARHLIAAIILATRCTSRALIDHVIGWSDWRRHHQAAARAAHYRRRLRAARATAAAGWLLDVPFTPA